MGAVSAWAGKRDRPVTALFWRFAALLVYLVEP
jgi:hypothetical protein